MIPAAVLGLVLLDRPDFFISSDTLLPAAFVWDALHHGYAWSGFQQARVPSFIPDLLVYGLVQPATGSWRVATAAWVFAVLLWLTALGSWIVARMARSGAESAALCFVGLTLAVLIAAMLGFPRQDAAMGMAGYFFPYLFVLLPFTHGGPFLLALTAAAAASREAERRDRARSLPLLGLSWAAGLSDLLCVTGLLVPLTAALLAGRQAGSIPTRTTCRLLSAAWGGAALGWALTQPLNRQPTPFPRSTDIPGHIGGFFADVANHPGMVLILGVLGLTLAIDARLRGRHRWLADFWPVFAATAALGSLVLTAALYEEIWSYRYALPFLWWAIILAASLLARVVWRRPVLVRVPLVAAVAALLLAYLASGWHAPVILAWESPLAVCLEKAGLHAGLADYWAARKNSAASNWRLQVEQITATGAAFVWGNDRLWFTHDIHDASRRPSFEFIIMDRLPEGGIAAAYGAPDHVLTCGGVKLWTYDDPERVYANLVRASPSLAGTFALAPTGTE